MASNFQEELLQSYSDADLAGHIHKSPRLAPSRIFLLSANLLVRYCEPRNLIEYCHGVERELGLMGSCS